MNYWMIEVSKYQPVKKNFKACDWHTNLFSSKTDEKKNKQIRHFSAEKDLECFENEFQ